MRVLLAMIAAATVVACSENSLCPYPNATPVEINPATSCLTTSVDTCLEPTLVVKNGCTDALYLPTEYGRFGPDGSVGADIEILATQTAHYVIRGDKATSSTSARKDYVIPARVGTQKIEFKFAILGNAE